MSEISIQGTSFAEYDAIRAAEKVLIPPETPDYQLSVDFSEPEESSEGGFVYEDPNKSEHRDRQFNAWRVPRTEAAQSVVDEVVSQLLNYEKLFALRKKSRRPNDQVTFEHTVSAIVCDLAYQFFASDYDQHVYISRSNGVIRKKSRYRPPAYNKTLPDILDRLAAPEMGFIDMKIGEVRPFGKALSTTIKAGPRLISLIEDHDLSLLDLGKSLGAEVIHLKREKTDHWDNGDRRLEYDDTPTTNLYRQQVHEINAWLDSMDIDFDEMAYSGGKYIDTNARALRRVFTMGRFDCCGRLYDGFWLPLSKTVRREGLYLNGEHIAELDYGQMGPRIVYGMCGAEPTTPDAYIIPGFEQYRKGIKKLFNSLIFDDWSEKVRNRMPKGVRKYIPKRFSAEAVINAIKETHSAIAEAFGTGIGHYIIFHESQIMVDLLLRLKGEDIPALPIHDAVLVPTSMQDETKKIMLKVFMDHTGVEGVVAVEEG